MRQLKNEEFIALGLGLIVLSAVPILLTLAGAGLLGYGAYEEFVKK